jgi:hypothetical protein
VIAARAESRPIPDALWLARETGLPARMAVRGDSMFPLLRQGDVAVCAPMEPCQARVGEVLVVRLGDTHVLHRCTRILPEGPRPMIVTRGDFSAGPDPAVPLENVLGRLVACERHGKPVPGEPLALRLLGRWFRGAPWKVKRALAGAVSLAGARTRRRRP